MAGGLTTLPIEIRGGKAPGGKGSPYDSAWIMLDVQVAYDIANGGHAERRNLAWMRSRADVTGPAGAPDGAVDAQDAFATQPAALLGWGEAI